MSTAPLTAALPAAIALLCLTFGASAQSDQLRLANDQAFKVSAPFSISPDARIRLYPTRNQFTFLQLDTATGQLWQVQYALKQGAAARFVLNGSELVNGGQNPGRFALYETSNMWNFLLVDQVDGRVWQAQFSIDKPELAGIFPLPIAARSTRAPNTDSAGAPDIEISRPAIRWDETPPSDPDQ